MITLGKAIAIASEGHKNQFDKSGKPYILHCITVMENVAQYKDEELSIIAILHDLIEDTSWKRKTDYLSSKEYLVHPTHKPILISSRVNKGLYLMTREKGETYKYYIDAIASNIDATRVKMADLEHNSQIFRLKGIAQEDTDRMIKYHKAYKQLEQTLKGHQNANTTK